MKGASDAADAYEDAAKAAAQAELEMYYQTRADQMPWLSAGGESLNQLRQMLGLSYYRPVAGGAGQTQSAPGGGIPVPPAPGITQAPLAGGQTSGLGGQTLTYYNSRDATNTPHMVTIPPDSAGRYAQAQAELQYYQNTYSGLSEKARESRGGPIEAKIRQLQSEIRQIELGQMGLAPPVEGAAPGGAAGGQGQAAPGWELVPATGEMAMGEFTESPGYQFTLSEGQRGIQNALAAMGKNRSGSHLRAATQYAEDMASTEYDNFLRRWYQSLTPYQSLAGLGQTSAAQLGQAGAAAGAGVAQNRLYAGDAQAYGSINQANALSGMLQGGANILMQQNALRNFFPSSGPYNPNVPTIRGGQGGGYGF